MIGCVTRDILRATGFRSAAPLAVMLARGEVVALSGRVHQLGLRLRERFALVEDAAAPARTRWRLRVTHYYYTFLLRDSGQELLAFHWHPDVVEKPFPHVHLEAGLEIRRDLVGVHVPTGRLTLPDVVRFAIEELRVRPRVADWRAVLDETHERLQAQPDAR